MSPQGAIFRGDARCFRERLPVGSTHGSPGWMCLDKRQGLSEEGFARLRAVPGGSSGRMGQRNDIGADAEDVNPVGVPDDLP